MKKAQRDEEGTEAQSKKAQRHKGEEIKRSDKNRRAFMTKEQRQEFFKTRSGVQPFLTLCLCASVPLCLLI